MKNTKRIVSLLLILTLIIGGLTFVKAAADTSSTLNISKGVRQGNIVTFTITLPKGGGLNGDANDNGRVDEYKDFDLNGKVEIADVVAINMEKELLTNPITLNGTLADDSTYEMSKNSDGTYKVEVTIPGDTDGTIGITIKDRVFKYSSTVANKEISSDLLTVSKDDNYDLNIKISEGVKEGNKVTFKIEAPKGTGLKGDVNNDGKVDSEDIQLLQDFLVKIEVGDEFNSVLADCVDDGTLNGFDLVALRRIVLYNSDDDKTNDSIKLNGTLAENSTYELVKDQDGSYKIVVTIPENAKEGTIGVTVDKEVLKTADKKLNKEVSSNEFDISKKDDSNKFKVIDEKQENTSDGKVKVTITVNKELDNDKLPEGWTLSEDGKTISKVMEDGKKEELTLVSKDGDTIKYNVNPELLKVIDQKGEDAGNGKIKVTITVNKELDKDKLPEGWTLSEDGKTISKVMNKDEEFKLTLVAKDGSTIEYSGIAKITNGDKTTAPGKIPQTGVRNTIIFVVVGIAIIGTVVFVKSRKMLK